MVGNIDRTHHRSSSRILDRSRHHPRSLHVYQPQLPPIASVHIHASSIVVFVTIGRHRRPPQLSSIAALLDRLTHADNSAAFSFFHIWDCTFRSPVLSTVLVSCTLDFSVGPYQEGAQLKVIRSTHDELRAGFDSKILHFRMLKGERRRTPFMHEKTTSPPPSFDWRKNGAINPIKNQGRCNSLLHNNRISCSNSDFSCNSNSRTTEKESNILRLGQLTVQVQGISRRITKLSSINSYTW